MRTARCLGLLATLTTLAIAGGLIQARPVLAASGITYTVSHQAHGTCATRFLPTIAAAIACVNADDPGPGTYDTIYIWQGLYLEHNLLVTSNVHIIGRGRNVTVDGQNLSRVFTLHNPSKSITVTIDGLIVEHGQDHSGGGLYADNGTFTLQNDIFSYNTALGSLPTDTADAQITAFGGGVYLYDCSCYLYNVQISHNNAVGRDSAGGDADGGGLAIFNAEALMDSNTIDHNSATGGSRTGTGTFGGRAQGGGFYLEDALLEMSNSQVIYNWATGGKSYGGTGGPGLGGGMHILNANAAGLYLNDISNNTAKGGYGADSAAEGGSASGGGIAILDVALTLQLGNVNGNTALAGGAVNPAKFIGGSTGGGIELESGVNLKTGGASLTISGASVSFNTTSSGSGDTAGAGIYIASDGSVTLNLASLKGNIALGNGSEGGGVYDLGHVTINNNTVISLNQAPGTGSRGGGLFVNTGGTGTASSDSTNTIKGNIAGVQTYDNCYPAAILPDCSP